MNSQTQINRDPCARASLMRTPDKDRGTCRWCGQPGRFAYGCERDGISTSYTRPHFEGPFCSVSCYRIYHA